MRNGGGVASRRSNADDSGSDGRNTIVVPTPRAPRSCTAKRKNRSSVNVLSRSRPQARPLQPGTDRRFTVPAHAVPPDDTERRADEPHQTDRVTLHDRRSRRFGQHDEIALGSCRPVEHDERLDAVERADRPARHPVGVSAHVVVGTLARLADEELESGRLVPLGDRLGSAARTTRSSGTRSS